MQHNEKNFNFELCFIRNLKAGQVIAEDIFVENRRLLSNGHVLTDRIITILKNRNIKQIKIAKRNDIIRSRQAHMDSLNQIKQKSLPPITNVPVEKIKIDSELDFFNALGTLSSETRYGKILQNANDIQFLNTLFANYIQNPIINKHLGQLKNYDENTYMHSIDVFIIGTLFAVSEGISNIEEIALGFLLHDIGKLTIENRLLNKLKDLTKQDYETIKQHTTQGHQLLSSIGLKKIAYLAKSHHERIDGSGYPEGLVEHQLSHELQILQLVDVYSAITMDRPYKAAASAVISMEIIFKQSQQFNTELLYRFVDFIGIYPENAIVLLSDGRQAIIERVNSMYPLLPIVKVFQTVETIEIPMDFSFYIKKLITYQADSPQELFSKFSDYLINNDEGQIKRYYVKLKEHYKKSEWFTHIYLPVFNVFRVMENYHMVSEIRLEEVKNTLLILLNHTLGKFRLNDDNKQKYILLMGNLNRPSIIKIFEGILHSNNIYPFVLTSQQTQEVIDKLIKHSHVEGLIVVDNQFEEIPLKLINHHYHLTEQQLETLLSRYLCSDIQNHDVLTDLSRYKTDSLMNFKNIEESVI